MRFDPAARQLHLGVRDLVGQETSRWDLAYFPLRAELGQALHTHRRRLREEDDPTFRAEVHLTHQLYHRGYQIFLQGRADGISARDSLTVVEELKSVALEPYELRGLSVHDLPTARLQVGFYLYFLHSQGVEALHGELVLCSIFDPSAEWVLPVPPLHSEVETYLTTRLDELLDELEAQEAWLAGRRALSHRLPFPFEHPRPIQQEMQLELESALAKGQPLLLEAPTGTGKTAAALYTVLKDAYARGLRVFFTTARTTGQQAALQVLQRMRDQGIPVSGVVLTARDKICPQPVVYCHPDHCPRAERMVEKMRQTRIRERLAGELSDRVPLEVAGQQTGTCPFELGLELTTRVDVVICDYNYVFDPAVQLRRIFQDGGHREWVVIVDEAHQLPPRAREYYSPLLSWRAMQLLQSWGEERRDGVGARAAGVARAVLRYLYQCLEEEGLTEVEEGRAFFTPEVGKLRQWQGLLALLLLDDPLRRQRPPGPGEEDVLLACYRQLTAFTEVASRLDDHFLAVVEREGEEARLRILCLDAAPELRKRFEGFAGVVAMSATLHPPEFYRDVLGLPMGAALASFPSPFPRENRAVLVVPVPDRYAQRAGALGQYAEVISQVVRARPGCYALYLPSFELLTALRSRLERENLELLVQDPRMDDLLRAALLKKLSAPLGGQGLFRGFASRLLVAVQGGSLAEAVEWPEGVLQGVMVLTPGLPRVSFEQEQLKAYFEERYGQGFGYAYLYPGMARVIQAAGRLIRREADRGVIVLMGERFAEPRYAALFPRDWYDHRPESLVVEALEEALAAFWARQPT